MVGVDDVFLLAVDEMNALPQLLVKYAQYGPHIPDISKWQIPELGIVEVKCRVIIHEIWFFLEVESRDEPDPIWFKSVHDLSLLTNAVLDECFAFLKDVD